MRKQYFIPILVAWIVLGISGTVALGLVKSPSTKRVLHRALVGFAGITFLFIVWYLEGSVRTLAFAAPVVLAITALNIWLVRICDSCAALIHPRYFVPPRFCSKCGAPLDSQRARRSAS